MSEEGDKKPEETKSSPLGIGITVAVLLGGGIFLAWCHYGAAGRQAKDQFVHENTCPADRVEMIGRSDIKGSQLETHKPPPKEIADDPGRYALWKKEDDQKRADEDSGGNYGVDVYELRGCGKTALYKCSSKPSCRDAKFPEGVTSKL
jgi:hypothetical protein